MRKYLVSMLAFVALFAGSCGTSGSTESADETTTTAGQGEQGDDGTTTTDDRGRSEDLVDVDDWAGDFCSSFETWLEGITSSAEAIQDGIVPGDLAGAKAVIVGLLDDVAAQTRTLIDEIESIGAPDMDRGERFLAELLDKFRAFASAIDAARSDAGAISTSDPASFQTAISELLATFQAETEKVGGSFSELDAEYGNAELDEAVNASCSFM